MIGVVNPEIPQKIEFYTNKETIRPIIISLGATEVIPIPKNGFVVYASLNQKFTKNDCIKQLNVLGLTRKDIAEIRGPLVFMSRSGCLTQDQINLLKKTFIV